MKRSNFWEGQIAFILRQAEEGTAIGEVCRKARIGEATFYVWRKKYGGLLPSEMKRLRQLEEETGKLKKIVADLSLDKAMLQDRLARKLRGLAAAGSWWPRFEVPGRSRFVAPAGYCGRTPPATTTRAAATTRPGSGSGSARSRRRACAAAIDPSTCCCAVKDGGPTPSGYNGPIGNWVCSSGTKCRSDGSTRSYEKTAVRRPGPTKPRQWTSMH